MHLACLERARPPPTSSASGVLSLFLCPFIYITKAFLSHSFLLPRLFDVLLLFPIVASLASIVLISVALFYIPTNYEVTRTAVYIISPMVKVSAAVGTFEVD